MKIIATNMFKLVLVVTAICTAGSIAVIIIASTIRIALWIIFH
jgi:hypothetical protein